MNTAMKELKKVGRELTLLMNTAALLGWDQETLIPEKAIPERAEQLALMEGISHAKLTDPKVGDLLDKLGADEKSSSGNENLSDEDRAYIRVFYRNYHRASCLPSDLVEEMARASSLGQSVWVQARKENDFGKFAPALEKILGLNREAGRLINVGDHPYDSFLDEYEPGMRKAELDVTFGALKEDLKSLVKRIKDAGQVEMGFLKRDYPEELQEKFGNYILKELAYPLDRGRLDVSTHPFTTTLGNHDVRITTRYGEPNPFSSLFSIIHEAGHGLYELGFSDEIAGNILAEGTSLGLHESQSRTWENMIGRSLPFWEKYYPEAQKTYGNALSDISLETFYKGINAVKPSLIRVDADEVTYSLHVILRYELETALFEGTLSVNDLPAAWNAKMEELLGIRPDSDANGVLQDVHWSVGLLGYFPTYALGNLYGAQFMDKAYKDVPDLDDQVRKGNHAVLLEWLRENIHKHGSAFTASELCVNVTGKPLDASYFTQYLNKKYGEVYGL
ncbi:MAG: carboxypeptidase M32 [Spirochaetales bacterium]|nr:carboxypeptidase M32 [Spirochaetales bacterium]